MLKMRFSTRANLAEIQPQKAPKCQKNAFLAKSSRSQCALPENRGGGGGGVLEKINSVGEVWIFSGITQWVKFSFLDHTVDLWNGLAVANLRIIDLLSLFSKKVNQFYISKVNSKEKENFLQFSDHLLLL